MLSWYATKKNHCITVLYGLPCHGKYSDHTMHATYARSTMGRLDATPSSMTAFMHSDWLVFVLDYLYYNTFLVFLYFCFLLILIIRTYKRGGKFGRIRTFVKTDHVSWSWSMIEFSQTFYCLHQVTHI